MDKLIIIGAGGMATNVVDHFNLEDIVTHYYDEPREENETLFDIPVKLEVPKPFVKTDVVSVIGKTRHKRDLIKRFILHCAKTGAGVYFGKLLSDDVNIAKSVEYGKDVVIQPATNIYARVKIGNHVLLCGGSRIGHDSIIHDYCTICPEVAMAGNVELHEGVFVGMNATISDGVKVGRGATIGAGAVVVKDIPPNWVVVGNPAKKIGWNSNW